MGGPGDHWYTDIFVWKRAAFGEPSDTLLREIREYGGDELLTYGTQLHERLWDLWPQWGSVDEDALNELARDLTRIRDDLRRQAVERGWQVE